MKQARDAAALATLFTDTRIPKGGASEPVSDTLLQQACTLA